jgi:hypothetical protein
LTEGIEIARSLELHQIEPTVRTAAITWVGSEECLEHLVGMHPNARAVKPCEDRAERVGILGLGEIRGNFVVEQTLLDVFDPTLLSLVEVATRQPLSESPKVT